MLTCTRYNLIKHQLRLHNSRYDDKFQLEPQIKEK